MNLELTTKITHSITNIVCFSHKFHAFNKFNTKWAVDTSSATAHRDISSFELSFILSKPFC